MPLVFMSKILYRDNSDIDLVIKGGPINLTTLQEIEYKLEDLFLPIQLI